MTCHECKHAKEKFKSRYHSILAYKISAVVMNTSSQPCLGFQLLLQRNQQQLLLHMKPQATKGDDQYVIAFTIEC